MYVQNASVTDPTLAPAGMSTLYLLIPVTQRHHNVDWRREGPRYREVALDQIERLGIKGVRDRIRYEKMLTPDDWQDNYEIYRGATFNLAHYLGQMLHMRPHNRFEDVERMYLVGGGTHPGSGLPVIYSSARITTKLMLEDLNISRPAKPLRPPRATPAAGPEPAAVLLGPP